MCDSYIVTICNPSVCGGVEIATNVFTSLSIVNVLRYGELVYYQVK